MSYDDDDSYDDDYSSSSGDPKRRGLCVFVALMVVLIGGAATAISLGINSSDGKESQEFAPPSLEFCKEIEKKAEPENLPNLKWYVVTAELETVVTKQLAGGERNQLLQSFDEAATYFQTYAGPKLAGCDDATNRTGRRNTIRNLMIQRNLLMIDPYVIQNSYFDAILKTNRPCSTLQDRPCHISIFDIRIAVLKQQNEAAILNELDVVLAEVGTLFSEQSSLVKEIKLTKLQVESFGDAAPTLAPTEPPSPRPTLDPTPAPVSSESPTTVSMETPPPTLYEYIGVGTASSTSSP